MTEALLCVFHSVRDEEGQEGCLSVYYSEGSPIISFCRYSLHNSNSQVLPFSIITNIVSNMSESTEINVVTAGQPVPSVFSLKSHMDVYTFFQITVANGILKASNDNVEVWVPAQGQRPSDPVDWVIQNSSIINPAQFHRNSMPPYNLTVIGTSYSLSSHREILKSLTEAGKTNNFFEILKKGYDKSSNKEFFAENKLQEYLTVRMQWECRIAHQIQGKSKHNNDVEKLSKDLMRSVSDQQQLKLVYNVLRTMLQFAPDLGYAQGMTDVAILLMKCVLGENVVCSDENQSAVFWALHKVMFVCGQSQWYMATEQSTAILIDDISSILSAVYPAIASFVSYSDYEMFQHISPCTFTMLTRTLGYEMMEKLMTLVIRSGSVNVLYTSILVTIFIIEFPNLTKSRVPDITQVTKLACDEYHVQDEDQFLSIVANICERVPKEEIDNSSMVSLSCKLFEPMKF